MTSTAAGGWRTRAHYPLHKTGSRRISRIAFGLSALCVSALATFAGTAHASDYPSAPITIIVPTTPGGGMDLMARVVSLKMGSIMKASFVVQNVPGANGIIGAQRVASAAPDGYTILLGQTAQMVINPYLYSHIPYDTFKSFVPIIQMSFAPGVVVVPKKSSIHTLADLVAAARKATAEGKSLNFATPGNGTPSHLTGVLFEQAAHIQLSHIAYKGADEAIMDTIGGRDDLLMSSIPTALAQIKSGQLRAIAVSAAKRSPSLPDVPTFAEQGYAGFESAGTWYGFFLPAKTPPAIVAALNKAANEALQSPEVIKTIQTDGGNPIGGSSQAFTAELKTEAVKWSGAVKASGAKVD